MASVAVLGATGFYWVNVGDIDEGTVTTDVIAEDVEQQRIPLDGAVDMLLVGIDSRTDAYGNELPREVLDMLHGGRPDGERNTDTMILVHIPVDGTRAIAISFPRDSWVELAGDFGKHRLNSAFAYAYNNAREELANTAPNEQELNAQATVEGRKNLIATVQQLIGDSVTIDRYAEVNLLSFYEVTNAIGGVEVCLNAPVDDRYSGSHFPAGTQTLAGAQALAFVRQRHGLPNGDLDRIVRQQAFLGAIADKVLSADMLTSPSKVNQLVKAVKSSVVLSDGWELSKFAAQMSGLTSDGIDFYTIPVVGDANRGGADVLDVDPEQVAQFVAALTEDGKPEEAPSGSVVPSGSGTAPTTSSAAPPPSSNDGRPTLGMVTVDVRNGSNTTGLAASVLDTLTGKGFQGGEIGDAPVQTSSVINYAPGEETLAQYAASELPGQFLLAEDSSVTPGTLSIVLGTNYPTDGNRLTGTPLVSLGQPDDSTPSAPPSSSGSATPTPQISADGLNCVN